MPFTPTTWINLSTPAVDANQLNRIEQGIVDAHKVGYINATWFDDAADDTAMINAAISEGVLTGKPVYIPAGTYDLSGPIAITGTVTIFGDGPGLTLLTPSADTDIFVIEGTGVMRENIHIRDITFDLTASSSPALKAEWVSNLSLTRVEVLNHDTGDGSVQLGSFTDPLDAAFARITNAVIRECRFVASSGVTTTALTISNATGVAVRDCLFEVADDVASGATGILVDHHAKDVQITHNRFRHMFNALGIEWTCSGVTFNDNDVESGNNVCRTATSSTATWGVVDGDSAAITDLAFIGNRIRGNDTGLVLVAIQGVRIEGNAFHVATFPTIAIWRGPSTGSGVGADPRHIIISRNQFFAPPTSNDIIELRVAAGVLDLIVTENQTTADHSNNLLEINGVAPAGAVDYVYVVGNYHPGSSDSIIFITGATQGTGWTLTPNLRIT